MTTLRPPRTTFSFVKSFSFLVVAALITLGSYAIHDINAHSAGITGQTQKTTTSGCYCHCTSASSSTTVTLSTGSGSSPLTAQPSTTYTFTVTVANSGESDGGVDISSYSGSGLSPGTGLQSGVSPQTSELTHTAPKSFSGGSTSWTFTYTTGSTSTWDTLYATGNAVNGDGMSDGDCSDNWNWAPKFIIHTVVPTKRIAFGRSSISLGQVRVGNRSADSLKVSSDGDQSITITSSAMKSGTQFSSFPSTTNRSLSSGSSEVDSVIFTPTARGTFSDSLVFLTNSDTAPQQHTGVYVSGQGIQGIFSAPNGTSLAFGDLRANRTSQMTFNYSNTGDDTIFLQTPSISGTGFSIVSGGTAAIIPPNQTGSVGVEFAPTAKQSYSGTLSFSASGGVTTPSVTLTGNGTLPQIQVSTPQYLGQSRVGVSLPGTIAFQNIGNDTLHISNANLSQTGSLFSLGTFDQTLLPNATGSFHISFVPDSEKTDTATLHFITDDPTDSAVSVIVTGSGTLPHMSVAQKGDTVDFGQVKVNSTASQGIAVTNNGAALLTLTNVSAGSAPFSVTGNPQVVNAEATADVTVSFAPTATGSFTGTLIISGDDAKNSSDTVYLKGSGINSSLTITPASLDFGSIPVSTTVTDTVVLSNTGTASLQINSYHIAPTNGAFAIVDSSAHQVTSANSAHVIVSFHPDTAGSYSGTLTLNTDDASAATRTISLSGRGVKGALTILPSTIDFGTLKIGQSKDSSVKLINSGQADISIASLSITGPGAAGFSNGTFTTPKTLHAGDTTSLSLIFMPTIAQSYNGMAQLKLGDGTLVGIILQGVGENISAVQNTVTPRPFSLSVSPNPASNMVTVHAMVEITAETMLDLFDASGHQVIHKDLGTLSTGAHDFMVPVADLASGTYFVRISNSNGDRIETSMVIER